MASIRHIESLVQAYIDDELRPAEKVQFERELAKSPSLAEALERQRAVSDALYQGFDECRLREDLTPKVMAHLPEMEAHAGVHHQRMVRELNRRAKNPRNSTRFIMTAVPAMAAALLLVMGLALYASWPSNEAGARQAVGMVTLADGSVYATESEGSPRRPVALQSFVRPGERYETGAGAAFAFGLAGPSEIRVAPDSRLKVGDARALSLEKGLIWLDVAEGDRHFRVETPAGNVTVFGTTFSVEVADGHTVVTLEDGEVNVENNVDFTVLHPDRQVTAGPNTRPLVPVTVDATALMAWADEFKPDDKAERLFLATIKTSDVKELRAEQIWRLDTRGKVVPRAITFEWNPDVYRVGHASYDVYVYDENMKPLFSSRIDGSEFGDKSHDHYTVRVPSHESLGEKTVFIKLVPDESTGSIETTFTEVSVVGM